MSSDRAHPPYDLAPLRAEVSILARAVPMNHCSQAPQTRRTRAAAERYLGSWEERGMDWDGWLAEVEAARRTFASLIGAHADEVAVVSSVSHAVSALASALSFPASRPCVVSSEAEFPTVKHLWAAQAARGADLVVTPARDHGPDATAYVEAIDERAAVVSAPLAGYRTGALLDLPPVLEAARAAGALTFVDAYQALGTVPLDVRELGVDALASGCLKYLMGIPGLAFLYVRRELADTLAPSTTGWFARRRPFEWDGTPDWAAGARRFDAGTPPIFEAYVCRAGMETVQEVGIRNVCAWTRRLSGWLVSGGRARGLEPVGPEDPARRAPTTAFRVSGNAADVEMRMRERHGVIASARGSAVRLAPHYYSTVEDVDRALDALAESAADVEAG